jgi:hypothetical protein
MTPPQPYNRTLSAWLPSAGYAYRKATQHVFSHVRIVPIAELHYPPGPQSMSDGHALIYRCLETNVERIWGME